MVLERPKLTVDDFYTFLESQEDDHRYELIEGEIVEMSPPTARNSELAAKLTILIGSYVYLHNLGYMLSADGGYTLSPGTIRIPDCSFISKDRFPDGLPERIEGGPDLAVEVISPSETATAIMKKVRMYLDAGTRLVWVIYPEDRVVDVYQPTENGYLLQTIVATGSLEGGNVLSGFVLPLKSLFS
ncbi:MAG: Uma2 family endonuclease [Anaerolineae bacterium]|nr:Uma2 family endonuclease [Anaerolineae bacterium]MCA9887658.1 Uma2 family endonuclease [Anaerolineae bacterium]